MPLFGSSSPFDPDVEKVTDEKNTTEDWGLILEICDKVSRGKPGSPKDCLRAIVKRVNHRVPHVSMQSLTLLNACVKNCGHAFHLEVSSREFVQEAKTMIHNRAHPKVADKLKELIKDWAHNEFKEDPSLSLIPSLYQELKREGHHFPSSADKPSKKSVPMEALKNPDAVTSTREEEDILKAIELSLKETSGSPAARKNSSGATGASASLYPAASSISSGSANAAGDVVRKVRALYDFEAAEHNELSFKEGELVSVLDDSDPNWWKGANWRGEGLFPANFVTTDLNVKPEEEEEEDDGGAGASVEAGAAAAAEVLTIDEEKINKTLAMLQNADPTEEIEKDPADLVTFEEQCHKMGPLIDTELEKIDRKHMTIMELNQKLVDALQMYHSLMKMPPMAGGATYMAPPPYQMPPPGSIPGSYPTTMAPPAVGGYVSAPPPYAAYNPGMPNGVGADYTQPPPPPSSNGDAPHTSAPPTAFPPQQQQPPGNPPAPTTSAPYHQQPPQQQQSSATVTSGYQPAGDPNTNPTVSSAAGGQSLPPPPYTSAPPPAHVSAGNAPAPPPPQVTTSAQNGDRGYDSAPSGPPMMFNPGAGMAMQGHYAPAPPQPLL